MIIILIGQRTKLLGGGSILVVENQKYYQLIQEFFLISEVPMLLNTSMNIKGEPLCCTPDDALQLLFATDIDVLVLGNSILEKQAAR